MAKQRETWSFVEQPRWIEGALHCEFIEGQKSDYAVQLERTPLGPGEKSLVPEISARVHVPPGALGYKPFELLEQREIGATKDPITQGLLSIWHGHAFSSALRASGEEVPAIYRGRYQSVYTIKVARPVLKEAYDLAIAEIDAFAEGSLDLHPGPVEVPVRKGRMWMWSARWRELYADPEWKDRPQGLNPNGDSWLIRSVFLGSVVR